jgi:RecD/TraA family predicted helicase
VSAKKVFETEEIETFLNEYCEENKIELEENQRQFFHDWNENAIMLLIGGGGMGKSWLQRILLELIAKRNYRTALLAPTGKASKVMTNYTGQQASTIHRKTGVFGEGEEGSKEITEDVIIVDESSMCDVFILAKFFKAVTNENARILFVGDDFQLASVGVGNFLYDVINSHCVKVSKLKKVFRQATGGILNVATDVREGKQFLNDNAEGRIVFGKDAVFWLTDSEYVRDGVLTNYKKVIERFNQDDVVILSPTNKGKLGTVELNKAIQKIANPASSRKKEKAVGAKGYETIFRVGDAVMNTVNTYGVETVAGGKADVFNGDTGKIVDIDDTDKAFVVEFDGIQVKMKFGTILTNLVHSWVTTIHKSQGSQYKVVIVILDKSATYQLNANLIYTALSRATDFLLVLGQASTINNGMKKFANMERRSFLKGFLRNFNEDTNEAIAGYNEVDSWIEEDESDIA